MRNKKTKIAVFGVFDRLHPGHLHFLYQARRKGDKLTAIIARANSVRKLKGKIPKDGESKRLRRVEDTGLVTAAILGDKKEGEYKILKKINPDIVVLGYDQKTLAADLKRAMKRGALPEIKILSAKPYKPKKYHTSKIS